MGRTPQLEDGYTRVATPLLEQVMRLPITKASAWRVLMAIVRETYGWNRKAAEITTARFLELTSLNKQTFYRGRDELLNLGIVQRDADSYQLDKARIGALSGDKKAPIGALEGTDRCPTGHVSVPKKAPIGALYYNKQIDKYKDTIDSGSVNRMQQLFNDTHHSVKGFAYNFRPGKDEPILYRLIQTYGEKGVALLIDQFFKSSDKWIRKCDYTIQAFDSQVQKLANELKTKMEGGDDRNPYLKHARNV